MRSGALTHPVSTRPRDLKVERSLLRLKWRPLAVGRIVQGVTPAASRWTAARVGEDGGL